MLLHLTLCISCFNNIHRLHDQRNEFNKNDRFYVWAKTAVEQEIQRTNNDGNYFVYLFIL